METLQEVIGSIELLSDDDKETLFETAILILKHLYYKKALRVTKTVHKSTTE